ncbi:MAG: UvrD-helicase domain-containing protein, partial [Planctomycetaceae bacterium]|nr:UvrD-helicase domain-containing protein [Planctomycetaceae bacterium]
SEAIDAELRRLLAAQDEGLLELAANFGLRDVRAMVHTLLVHGREPIEPEAWGERTPAELVETWLRFRERECLPRLVARLQRPAEFQEMIALLERIESDNPLLQQRRGAILEAWRGLGVHNLSTAIETLREQALVKGKGVDASLKELGVYEQVRDVVKEFRKVLDEVAEKLAWNPAVAQRAASAGLQLLRLAGAIQAKYAAAKKRAAALDFRDLVGQTRAVLLDERHAELRQRLAADIRLLLVDEFQDTDPRQVELIEALCGEGVAAGQLFFVGDFKQSIYRFRGADPAVFAQLRAKIAVAGQLPLTENFRSQPAILNFVNALFADALEGEYEPLVPRRPQVSPEPAVEFLWAVPAAGEGTDVKALRGAEADWIARRIRQLIDSREPLVWDAAAAARDEPAARPAQLGDFAILFRALSDVHRYEDALRKYGLDYYLVGGHAFYSQQEVFDLLNLLRALDSPADMVSLVGVLRSPFCALDDEAIFWLGQHPEGLATGLARWAECSELSPVQRERAAFAACVLGELREAKDRLPVAALIDRALTLTGYDALLLTEFLGSRKLANLRKLVEQARSFDSSGIGTLAEYVRQLDEFVSRQPDEAMAATEPEAADVIRLMTIHQSKGLEFPIVVVPDLQRVSRSSSGAVYSAELGPLVKLPRELETSVGMTGRDLYGIVEADHEQAESARLLYVATTRAADYLLLASGVKQVGEGGSNWLKLLRRRFELTSGHVLGSLPPGYAVPRVRVTATRPELPEGSTTRAARVDLESALSAAEKLSLQHAGELPTGVDAIPVDLSDRRLFSFSELDGALRTVGAHAEGEFEVGRADDPRSRGESQLLGTLVHALLAEWNRRPDLELAARAMHLVQLLGEPGGQDDFDRDAVVARAVSLVQTFLASPRSAQLLASVERHAEVEFLLAWPPGGTGDAHTYFRGFLDLLWRDSAGRWHVLDYKTNRVTMAEVPRAAKTYVSQMLLYALAVEQAVGEPPASLTLSFLEPGVEFDVPYSADSRREAIARIDAALAAYRRGDTMDPA